MEQLVMKAAAPYAGRMGVLPEGYRFVPFGGSAEDVADWKRIIMEPPSPPDGADSCYHLMIEIYPDVIPEKDIHFIENVAGERVGTITTITHLKYIEKIADNVGGRTFGQDRSGGSTNDISTTEYSIADLFSFVKKYDAEFKPKRRQRIYTYGESYADRTWKRSGTPYGGICAGSVPDTRRSLCDPDHR